LVVLEALLIERHVGRAAERLHLTQSAVSHALNHMREIFNDPLFIRVTVGVVPTPRALALVEPLVGVLSEIRKMIIPATPFDPQVATGCITLGTTDYSSLELIPSLIPFMQKNSPNLHLVMRNLYVDRITGDLDGREYDIAVAPFSEGLPKRFATIPLFRDHITLAARKDHPLLQKPLTIDTFSKLRHLLVVTSRTANTALHATLNPYGVCEKNIGMVIPHFASAGFIVANSDLVMLVPSRVAKRFADVAGFVIHELPVPTLQTFEMGLVFSRERASAEPVLAWFLSAIKNLSLTQEIDKAHALG
jgi:DNA-binding transcriptional LysR family regulator